MKVAVIQGGPSTEAEVSRKSAAAVHEALVTAGHQADCFELDGALSSELLQAGPDVVFPVVHGSQGEDGCLQGLLEVLGLPYVGSDVRASAIAADKLASKLFFRESGLLVAKDRRLEAKDQQSPPKDLWRSLQKELGPEMVVKPAQGGSTIGIERLLEGSGAEDFARALDGALKYDPVALAETYVAGQELTCAVLDEDEGPRALPVTLITSESADWYDFDAKYAPGGSSHQCPAPLSSEITQAIQAASVAAHLSIGARDLSRSDFILAPSGDAYLLELNTLPGMTSTSLFPEAAQAAGLTFPALADHLVKRAAARGARAGLVGRPLPGR
jgi:D-alanine-D-alanine ligase